MAAVSQIFILLSAGIHHSPPQGATERAGRQECKEGTGEKANKNKKEKSPEEVQHPVLNHGCFLMKPALLLSNQSHLWSPQSPARKKEKGVIANGERRLMTA